MREQRLLVRHPPEGAPFGAAYAPRLPRRRPHGAREALEDAHDVVGPHEGRLEVHLRELGLAVGAAQLVAVAARHLEVPLHPRRHEQLLVLLRRLRQRVRGARRPAARGHQELARALGRGPEERGRLHLEEAELGEVRARGGGRRGARAQVAPQGGAAAQLEVAPPQCRLAAGGRRGAAGAHGDGQRRDRSVEHLDVVHGELELPRGPLLGPRLGGGAQAHCAAHAHGALLGRARQRGQGALAAP